MGIDNAYRDRRSISTRNKIFTAITRSKCWVTLTGSSSAAESFKEEIDKTLSDFPQFKFIMPDKANLKQYQRDLNDDQAELNKMHKELEEMASRRGVSIQDLLGEFDQGKKK